MKGNPLDRIDVILAPLAGYTDSVFRRICLEHGADLVVTEMISANGLVRKSHRVRAIRNLDMEEGPIALQIFGADPETMGEAAARLSRLSPLFIDLNFGCPVKKIVNKEGGAALLRDLERLERICRTVVAHSAVPVSAKVRAGWDSASERHVREIACAIEESGVSMLTVHARTRSQVFQGKADWALIRAAKEAVSIPVVGNGDVFSARDFFRMKEEAGCDAVMIGRGAIGNPWIFAEIKCLLEKRTFTPPSFGDQLGVLLHHVRKSVEKIGEPLGLVTSRRVMAVYVRHLPFARDLRSVLMGCERLADLERVVYDYARQNAIDVVPYTPVQEKMNKKAIQ